MGKERLLDDGESLFQRGVGSDGFPEADKGPYDIDTHGDGFRAIENVGGLEGAMFRESPGPRAATATTSF